MGLYEPAIALKPALRGTITSGQTASVTLGPGVEYVQVERVESSEGTLQYVLSEGEVATEYYEQTAASPMSGFMPVSDRSATLKAVGGDVTYCIWRLGKPA